MPVPYFKIILLFAIFSTFISNFTSADDTITQSPTLSYKPKFHMTCIDGSGRILYTNVICPESWGDYHQLEKTGKTISSLLKDSTDISQKKTDTNEMNDSIKVASLNSKE